MGFAYVIINSLLHLLISIATTSAVLSAGHLVKYYCEVLYTFSNATLQLVPVFLSLNLLLLLHQWIAIIYLRPVPVAPWQYISSLS